jgi:hypothetical protein
MTEKKQKKQTQPTPLGKPLSSVMADLFVEESEKKGRVASLKRIGV